MLIYIACAKIMRSGNGAIEQTSIPTFQVEANQLALQMTNFAPPELQKMLRTNTKIAQETWSRYHAFFDSTSPPEAAAFSYDGMVYQKLAPETLSQDELLYANGHLLIGSFLYGLLKPLDLIKKYRLEGDVILPQNEEKNLFVYWKPILTDYFIKRVKEAGGVLLNLSSDELCHILDWKRVTKEVQVVSPTFLVLKGTQLKTIVIYTKMCRGAMARFAIKNRINDIDSLKSFEYEGFHWDKTNPYDFQFNLL